MPGPFCEAEFSLLDDVFEAVPAPVLGVLLEVDTVMPLPHGREEVSFLIIAVSLLVALPTNVVALPPSMIGLPLPLPVLVTDGIASSKATLGQI